MRILFPALARPLAAPCMAQRTARCADALFLDGNDTAMLRVGGGVELVGFIGGFAR